MKRSSFLEHVGWTGAGIAYTLSAAGIVSGRAIGDDRSGPVDFVQISDSHIGFHQEANPDVAGTLKEVVTRINALAVQPKFIVHTGDITHLSTPQQFDDAKNILSQLKAPLFALPGEHDVLGNDLKPYLSNFKLPDAGENGWASFDRNGVHYVALVNVFNFEKMGLLGTKQLAWLEADLSYQKKSTPIVVFTHVPLYALYPQWGWTTEDGSNALALLSPFDHVTILNGHIHQVVEHSEGNIRFASAAATAYPQPKPGMASKPGPVTLAHDDLLHVIGYRTVEVDGTHVRYEDRTLA